MADKPAGRRGLLSLVRLPLVQALLLLLAVGWVAHFFYFRDLGLYEDDYFFISYAIGDDGSYLAERVQNFVNWPQGRPIGFLLPPLFSFLGDRLGGLPGIYVVAFLVVSLNAFLFYLLLRVRFSQFVAVSGALLFLLFPADTTKFLLTHSFQLQPSLTFLLLASLLYLRDRKLLAYLVAPGALLAYESGFLPFFAVPLLKQHWDRKLLAELARHAAILVGILALAVLIRYLAGEERATGVTGGVLEILPLAAASMVLGPLRSLLLFLYGPLREIPGWNLPTLLAVVGSATVFFWTLLRWRTVEVEPSDRQAQGSGRWWAGAGRLGQLPEPFRLLLAGLALLMLAYALAFTHFPPHAVLGRSTSVHLAATFGSAVIFAALVLAAVRLTDRYRLSALAAAGVAVYLALLVGYHFTVQRDFVRSWEIQRSFWTQVVELAPDMQEGTIILFALDGGETTRFIQTNSWADAIVLEQVYRFPSDWADPPRLFPIRPDWVERVEVRDGQLWWRVPAASWDEYLDVLPQGNVIYLDLADGRLERREGALSLYGHTLHLKEPAGISEPPWDGGPLFDHLVES